MLIFPSFFLSFFPFSFLSLLLRSSRVFFLDRESKQNQSNSGYHLPIILLPKYVKAVKKTWKRDKGIRPFLVKFKMAADSDSQKRKRLEGAHYKNTELPQEDEPLSQPKHHIREQLASKQVNCCYLVGYNKKILSRVVFQKRWLRSHVSLKYLTRFSNSLDLSLEAFSFREMSMKGLLLGYLW